MKRTSLITVFALTISTPALARPEYATKEKLNCVACHASPWGGGPRTVMGKTYGSHGHTPAKTSSSDLYYASLRFIDYYSTDSTHKRANGAGIMEAAVTGNVPIIQNDDGSEMRGVLTYNIPTLAPANLREAYIRWQLSAQSGRTPTYVLVGRFYMPFGLLTDEHRAYTKIQTNMTINNFDIGAALSVNPTESFHFDLALVNDFQTGGAFNTGELPWGVVGNVRWNPESLPLLFGVSGNYEHTITVPQPYAGSFYSVLSADRLTDNTVSGSLQAEAVWAKNWNNPAVNTGLVNPSLSQYFIPAANSGYLPSVLDTTSFGIFGQAKYNLTHVWTLMYRLDYFAPDMGTLSNHYVRNGFGFESYLNSNLIWQVRYETVSVPGFIDSSSNTTFATQSDIFTMLRLWI
jgi:hypothetical protein